MLLAIFVQVLCGEAALAGCKMMYGIDRDRDMVFRIDSRTGRSVPVGPLGFNINSAAADFASDGTLWGFSQLATGGWVLYTVDLQTGVGSIVQHFNNAGSYIMTYVVRAELVSQEMGEAYTSWMWRTARS